MEIKKYIQSGIWTVIGSIFVASFSLAATVLIARILGPVGFGKLSFVVSFVMLFSFIATGGLGAILNKHLSRDPERYVVIIAGGIVVQFFLSILSFVLMLATSIMIEKDLILIGYMGMQSLVYFTSIFTIHEWWYDAKGMGRKNAVAKIFAAIFSNLGKIISVLVGWGIPGIIAFTVLESVVIGYFLIPRPWNNVFLVEWSSVKKQSLGMIRESYPLIFSAGAIVLYQQIDQIMLKYMVGFSEVGVYSASIRFYTLAALIPAGLSKAFAANIHRSRIKDVVLYKQQCQLLMDICFWVSFIVCFVFVFFARHAVRILFGDNYMLAAHLAVISIWRTVFFAFGVSSGQWIISENLQKYAPYRTFSGLFVNLVLNYIWIPKYGVEGAAWATLLSFFVASWGIHFFIPSLRPLCSMQIRSVLWGIPNLWVRWSNMIGKKT